jgi:DNA helicase-2/ATP-dependent DNA helicase PcrA
VKLNSAQQAAVDEIFGPVLVIAGPGTGKTQLLASRVAAILEKTDTDPEGVLVLTFSEAGTAAIRARLVKIIGAAGWRVAVSTFHGFCRRVIDEFPEKFLEKKKLRQLGDLERIQLLRGLLEKKRPELLTTPGDPFFFLGEISARIAELKREGISPAALAEKVSSWKKELEAAPRLNKRTGAPLKAWEAELRKAEKAAQLAELFVDFEKKKEAGGWFDFEDSILFVLNKLRADADLRAELAERHLFLLVDEYQDTNSAQNQLLLLLSESEVGDAPNICAVGDDDQTIFRFQGASLENLLFFEKNFPGARKILLTENYRSRQEILDAASLLISKNEARLAEGKELRAAA